MHKRNPLKNAFVASLGTLVVLIVAALLVLPRTPQPAGADGDMPYDGPVVFSDVRLFDGRDWDDATSLRIENGHVTAVGDDVDQTGARVIPGAGLTVLPGLIDAHVHAFGPALIDSLRFGVTTGLDMFTAVPEVQTGRERRVQTGPTSRSDLFSAGTLATVADGHGTQYGFDIDVIDADEDVAAWVARRKEEGSDYIKLVYMPYQTRIPSLDLATASAVIEEAHRADLLAVAHISTARGAMDLLEAGVDGLVHVFADEPVSDAFIERAREDGLFVIPTLSVLATADQAGEGARLAKDTHIAPYLAEYQKTSLMTDFGMRVPTMGLREASENTRRMHAGGVRILAGSDAPNPGTAHGASLHQELALLVRAGLSATDALMAATSLPADAFGLAARGAVAPGARADFVVIDGDPRDDIEATRRIVHVFKNGFEVARELEPSTGAPALPDGLLGDFSQGPDAPDGFAWSATDDREFGGQSVATLSHIDDDGGALRVVSEIRRGFPFPWAGFVFSTTDNSGRSYRDVDHLRLRLRGTPGNYRVMFFNEASMGAPPTATITVTDTWQDITVTLDDLPTLNRNNITGFAIVAGPEPTTATLDLHSVGVGPRK